MLYFRNAWGCREGPGWGGVRVGSGGGEGHSDVNSMSDMQKLLASTTFLLILRG